MECVDEQGGWGFGRNCILRLIAAGQSNQQIAAQLIIAPGTAKWYVSQIFGKLGVHSRTQSIVRAQELSLLA